ncbi:S1C family serine protease, partial [Xanthovirga aplysinae]|uniref:S1C family serine protease n=1 Tax=Xanthovirga aplysinae TaxID=2529853 RepID=UPI0012BB4ACE
MGSINKKQYLLNLLIASFVGGMLALGGDYIVTQNIEPKPNSYPRNYPPSNLSGDKKESNRIEQVHLDFSHASSLATQAVVHIRSVYPSNLKKGENSSSMGNWFKDFFEKDKLQPNDENENPLEGKVAGSGVLISPDGYLITNLHVIEGAELINITLANNQRYQANIIGVDPTTDLALLKIAGLVFPYLKFANSDQLQIGQWVLAVGNPFDLPSTVTAGIISAIARNIDVLQNQDGLEIESFIQTDAAINPGNSGGALVNVKGELVGINTAIATPTGSYAGYSFAVPSAIVKKVAEDLLEFGRVKRGLLGIRVKDVDAALAKKEGLDNCQGILILEVKPGGAADQAGIRKGDVIVGIEGFEALSIAQLQGHVARYRPGKRIALLVKRGSREWTTYAILKNKNGNITLPEELKALEIEGVSFRSIDVRIQNRLGIPHGVEILQLKSDRW